MSRIERRVLIYSHDSYGLGHLRRCRAIAHSLVRHNAQTSVLILSGSPIISSFNFNQRVDFIRLPGIIKLPSGEYGSHSLQLSIDDTVAIRAAVIKATAEEFDPDLFIVDKEPHGLRGEVSETLAMLQDRGTHLVLGLRDIMDEPELLVPEWRRKRAMPTLEHIYDEIWVYGLPQICDPLAGLSVPETVRRKMVFTGYLGRRLPDNAPRPFAFADRDYILVTAGGGGDGTAMIDWVLRAYESDDQLPMPAFIVFGPFLDLDAQASFNERIAKLPNVEAIAFESAPEQLMAGAAGVVAMCGYNTFCEIISFDCKAVVIPRTRPRLEQFIRANRAQELGLINILLEEGDLDAGVMATALRHLPQQGLPSQVVLPGLLDGLDNVNRLVDRLFASGRPRRGLHVAATP
ncbi:MAG: glycosyltransferase family protein [Alphaproteobacteria bacterium]